ncbi:MAG: hypothetical protein WBQ73_00710 [Candidatus Babeliales bacterium]
MNYNLIITIALLALNPLPAFASSMHKRRPFPHQNLGNNHLTRQPHRSDRNQQEYTTLRLKLPQGKCPLPLACFCVFACGCGSKKNRQSQLRED